jgi:hypothetical protein
MNKEKHFGLRIEDGLLERFRFVCKYEGRSANNQILYLIRKCIAEFEEKNGIIDNRQRNG